MKSHGVFASLCRSLDCMEEEMQGLCSLFGSLCCKKHPKHTPRGKKSVCNQLHDCPLAQDEQCVNRTEKCEIFD